MSTLGQVKITALTNITLPAHLVVEVQKDYDALMNDVGRRSVGFDGVTLFGCAFIQGGRLQFTTAMPIQKMLDISEHHRAAKGANVKEVLQESNRAREPGHEKKIGEYLIKTACVGEKFILPSFTFNFGTRAEDDTPDVSLILLDRGHDGSTTWPAVLLLPRGAKLETTDGAHRRNILKELLLGKKLGEDERDRLLDNAVDVKLVFEDSMRDSHQDFADCGRTKPIGKSTLYAFDARDQRNRMATALATTHPFLNEYVDGSANNVNLSAKSHRVWSLAAVRTMMEHIVVNHPDKEMTPELKVQHLGPFFDQLIKHLPQLKALEVNRREKVKEPATESITGDLREHSGGDVALRGAGLFMFARAYLHCVRHDLPHGDMATALAQIDWHALNCGRNEIPVDDDVDVYGNAVMEHANPIWRRLLVIKPRRYKISSSTLDANSCWDRIVAQLFPHAIQQAAE